MERLTIPDTPIEGGLRRTVIDAREVRKHAMTIYWQLKKYEDVGLTPDQIREFDKLYLAKCEEVNQLKAELETERQKHRWIPVEERLPETDTYILLSFLNFSLPMEGQYREYEDGGAFYLGDCDEGDTCISDGLYVNAWQPLPESYQPEKGGAAG